MTIVLIIIAAGLAADRLAAWIAPWRACTCGARGCVRCHWLGKRPKLLARIVRREVLRREGWYGDAQ